MFVKSHARGFQPLHGRDEIGGAHVPARTVSDIEPILLHPAEECHFAGGGEGESAVIEKEYAAVGGGAPRRFAHAGESFPEGASGVDVLHRASRDLIDEQREFAGEAFCDVHVSSLIGVRLLSKCGVYMAICVVQASVLSSERHNLSTFAARSSKSTRGRTGESAGQSEGLK